LGFRDLQNFADVSFFGLPLYKPTYSTTTSIKLRLQKILSTWCLTKQPLSNNPILKGCETNPTDIAFS